VKSLRNTLPRNFFCPAGKIFCIIYCQAVLPVTPWNFFDNYTLAVRTSDPAHGVAEENEKSPGWYELEQAFRQSIIARGWSLATTAKRLAVASRMDFHDNCTFLFIKTGIANTKTLEIQTLIEYCFYAHGSP
jgi:hypothetical protein